MPVPREQTEYPAAVSVYHPSRSQSLDATAVVVETVAPSVGLEILDIEAVPAAYFADNAVVADTAYSADTAAEKDGHLDTAPITSAVLPLAALETTCSTLQTAAATEAISANLVAPNQHNPNFQPANLPNSIALHTESLHIAIDPIAIQCHHKHSQHLAPSSTAYSPPRLPEAGS